MKGLQVEATMDDVACSGFLLSNAAKRRVTGGLPSQGLCAAVVGDAAILMSSHRQLVHVGILKYNNIVSGLKDDTSS